MLIKKGDNVRMLLGKDRGKAGKVLFVFPKENKVVIESLNLMKRHLRPKKQGQKGQIVNKEKAVDISNVMLICSKCGKSARFGYRLEEKVKTRICKKCGGEN